MTKVYTQHIAASPEAVSQALARMLPPGAGASSYDPPQLKISDSATASVTMGTEWRYETYLNSQVRHSQFDLNQERQYTTLNCVAGRWSDRGGVKQHLRELADSISRDIGVAPDQLPVRWTGHGDGLRDDGFDTAMRADLAAGTLPFRTTIKEGDPETTVTFLRADGGRVGTLAAHGVTAMGVGYALSQVAVNVEIGPGATQQEALTVAQAVNYWSRGYQVNGQTPPQKPGPASTGHDGL